MKSIPFFDYPALWAQQRERLAPVIEDVLSRGAFIMQQDLLDFEAALAKYLGVRHAIGVADGTIALVMGLRCAGVGPGDEVIVPSHTFVASASAIFQVGAKPVLADCAADHLMDAASVRRLVSPRTRAIMPVHLNGRVARMDELLELAREFGLAIVEDSAQALGARYKERFAGTFGVSGSCSFFPAKTLGCFGDGGAVFTDSDEVAEKVRLMRDHGRCAATGDVVTWGYNARLDNLQAAILGVKLQTYDSEIARRREIARMYCQRLEHLPDLVLPPGPDASGDHFDIFQNFELEAGQRDALRAHLHDHGVKTIIQWGGKTIHQFKALGLNRDLPNTERLTKRFFLLPMNTSLSDDDVSYICDTIEAFYQAHA